MVAYIVEELRFQIDASSFVPFIVCFRPLRQSPASMQPPPAKPSYVTFRSRKERGEEKEEHEKSLKRAEGRFMPRKGIDCLTLLFCDEIWSDVIDTASK
ncbi:unnamed protein product [Clavelina lepadiformis]|uniref:Uncharacterized protein n=1 Tax=Clavelina lepadiformis TaxID=159417 RepID=A0ABP0G2V4_CLALP